MDTFEERIALFLDYENLAIGARDNLGGMQFDLRPVLDALAERGRVIARKAYADWSYFDEDRRCPDPSSRRADRDPAADAHLAQERRRHQARCRCPGDGVRARVHHHVRDLHGRQRPHPARAQAAGAEQAGDRRGHQGVDLRAVAARVRRVPVLRHAGRCGRAGWRGTLARSVPPAESTREPAAVPSSRPRRRPIPTPAPTSILATSISSRSWSPRPWPGSSARPAVVRCWPRR